MIAIILYYYMYLIIYREKTKTSRRKGRENQGEGCRRHLRQFLASLLLRLLSTPSTPSPAAHHFARLCQRSWRGTGGHLVRFWSMLSPHLATTSPANSSQQTAGQRLDGLTSCPPRPRPLPSGGKGRAPSQPGRAIPSSSPRRPSPPCRGAWA